MSAAQIALDALESIALAGMSGTGQESPEAITEWHARQAWKFISIAAQAIGPLRDEIAQEVEPVAWLRTGATTALHNVVFDKPESGPWTPLCAAPQAVNAWQPIETAPENQLVVTTWEDKDDKELCHNFDFLEDGVWQNYFNEHEHYLIAGAARGRSEDAPYTHWMPLPGAPA